jgi:kynurenine 3-monooxygenase
MSKKVAIVGAGPGGLLLAHYLLRRGDKYQINIYERRSDPRIVSFSKSRTFPITLNERGMIALRKIEGLEEAVKAISVEMTGTIFHQKNGKTRVTQRKKPLIALDRTSLVIVLLEKLTQQYDNSRLNIHFNCQCTQVDFTEKTAKFKNIAEEISTELEEHFTIDYDLLIGADGSRSVVREHFLYTELFDYQQKYVPTDYKSILLPRYDDKSNIDLKPGKIYSWRTDDGTTLLALHQVDGTLNGAILFLDNQSQVGSLSTTEAVLKYFQDNFPQISHLMSQEDAEAFLSRPISKILTIRCSRYHHGDSVLLIGDAAHAVSASIGQGCNAALEDVTVFDHLLDEYSDNFAAAIEQFTIRRKRDAHALVDLGDYAFPSFSSKGLFLEFTFREICAKILHQLFPQRFSPSLVELIFESSVPYSVIMNSYQGWISKVKKSNEKILKNF